MHDLSCFTFQLRPGDVKPNCANGQQIGEGAAILICGLLRFNATVEELGMGGHTHGPDFLHGLTIALESKDSKLAKIDLSRCFTGKDKDSDTLKRTRELAKVLGKMSAPPARSIALDAHKKAGSSFLSVSEMKAAATIDVSALGLTALSATAIGEWIVQGNGSLTRLDASSNTFLDEGFVAIARALKEPGVKATELSLKKNDGKAAGSLAVAEMVASSTIIRTLNLSSNPNLMKALRNDSSTPPVTAWANALEKNSSLTMLDVRETGLVDANLRELGEVLLRPGRDRRGLSHLSCALMRY